MRRVSWGWILIALLCSTCAWSQAAPEQQPETFRWMDFHSEKDQPIITWVTRSLDAQKWTAIREIGAYYDAALVVTTNRKNPDSSPGSDTFDVWSVSLTKHAATPLLKGVNLRYLDWMLFREGAARELAVLYDDCRDCNATTYFTAFYYDITQHLFISRWMRGAQAIPVWASTAPPGVDMTQVYALLSQPNAVELLGTWIHYDYGKEKDPEDFVYRYDRDPFSGLERTQLLSGKDAEAMKVRLCSVQGAPMELARGQESALCQQLVHPRPERKPVTTPPANNRGRSAPPGAHK